MQMSKLYSSNARRSSTSVAPTRTTARDRVLGRDTEASGAIAALVLLANAHSPPAAAPHFFELTGIPHDRERQIARTYPRLPRNVQIKSILQTPALVTGQALQADPEISAALLRLVGSRGAGIRRRTIYLPAFDPRIGTKGDTLHRVESSSLAPQGYVIRRGPKAGEAPGSAPGLAPSRRGQDRSSEGK